jgi:TolB protein
MRACPTLLLVIGLGLSACGDPGDPSTTGTLVVSTATAGDDPDQDGYLVTIDEVDSIGLDPTGTAEVELPAGRHTLKLLGVATQCSVALGTTLEVDVLLQSTTSVTFEVSCVATGARVMVTTTGLDIDPNGYGVVSGGSERATVPSNGTVLIPLASGDWTIGLNGLAPNCAIDGLSSRSLTILGTDVVTIEFAVFCTATSGVIGIGIAGTSLGVVHQAALDGGTPFPVTPNSRTYLAGVAIGDHVVSLSSSCSVEIDRQSITVTAGGLIRDTVEVTFAVVCTARSGVLAFTHHDGDLHLINADGTNLRDLTTDGLAGLDWYATWSPRGDRIAFTRIVDGSEHSEEIHLINADGANLVQLSPPGVLDYELTWSPGGERIAFVHTDPQDNETPQQIYVMTAGGTNRMRLSPPGAWDYDPAWSPDGQRIAFVHFDSRNRIEQIYVMNSDGKNRIPLTTLSSGARGAIWSPDGGKIAFVAGAKYSGGNNDDIYVMDADGTNLSALTNDSARDFNPAWSPDGSRIVFSKGRALFVINADGTHRSRLTSPPATRWSYDDYEPAWSPDGRAIVFTRSYDCDPFNDNGGPPCMSKELRTIQLTSATLVSSLVTQGEAATWRP